MTVEVLLILSDVVNDISISTWSGWDCTEPVRSGLVKPTRWSAELRKPSEADRSSRTARCANQGK